MGLLYDLICNKDKKESPSMIQIFGEENDNKNPEETEC
jgi:hypothetical protein